MNHCQNVLIQTFKYVKLGTEQFALKIDSGINRDEGVLFECSITGTGQGKTTGMVASKVAEKLITTSFESGVYHIEQLFDPKTFINELNTAIEYKETKFKTEKAHNIGYDDNASYRSHYA